MRKRVQNLKINNFSFLWVFFIGLAGWIVYQNLGSVWLTSIVYLTVGFWGIISIVRGNLVAWSYSALFIAASESVVRGGVGVGYLSFYYFLILSFFLFKGRYQSIEIDNSQRKIIRTLLAISIIIIFHFSFSGGYFLGVRKFGVIWLGVALGSILFSNIQFNKQYIIQAFFWIVAGGLLTMINFLGDPVLKEGRYFGRFDGTGPISAIAGLIFLMCILLLIKNRRFGVPIWVYAILISISSIVEFMTASRATAISIIAALGLWVLLIPGTKFYYRILAGIFITFIVLAGINIEERYFGILGSRFEEMTDPELREGRLIINRAVWESFKDRPILGGGSGSWRAEQQEYLKRVIQPGRNIVEQMDTHNTFLEFLYEHGIIGLFCIALLFYLLLVRSYQIESVTSIPLLPMILYSIFLGFTTLHKQAPMFIPFLLVVSSISYEKKD